MKELATPLMNFPSSRLVRKVAAAALRSVVSTDSCPLWNEYFVLLNALEESQVASISTREFLLGCDAVGFHYSLFVTSKCCF